MDPYATVKSVRESGHATLSTCLPCGSLTTHKSHRECGLLIAVGVDVVAVPDKVTS